MGLTSTAIETEMTVLGTDGKEYKLKVLTMKQMNQLSDLWLERQREKLQKMIDKMMSLTAGQKLQACFDLTKNTPSVYDVANYAVSTEGCDDALKLSTGLTDVEVLGDIWTRSRLANIVVGFEPVNPKSPESLSDFTETSSTTKTD